MALKAFSLLIESSRSFMMRRLRTIVKEVEKWYVLPRKLGRHVILFFFTIIIRRAL
jgi:hypothetical protein